MRKALILIFSSLAFLALDHTGQAADLAWWVDWSMRPTGTNVEGVPIRVLNPGWRHASVIRPLDLPAASRHEGDRPEDNGAVFSVDIDLDGDSREERVVVGVYETTAGTIGRFLLVLGRARAEEPWSKRSLFTLNDPNPFSAIRIVQGNAHWVGCFECDDDCTVVRSNSGFRLNC